MGRGLEPPARRDRRDHQDVIDRNEIIKRADADDVPAPTVERDYVLAHVMCGIARHDAATGMIFKGGTALRLCYVEGFRYSADLDFSLEGLSRDDATALVVEALEGLKDTLGFPELGLAHSESVEATEGPNVTPGRVYYLGPLGRRREIKLDLADDELIEEVSTASIIARYSDQPEGVETRVYARGEITAEKLRCILQRLQCRDLLDLWELLERHDQRPDEIWPTFERKARHRDFDPDVFAERFERRVAEYQKRWDGELEGLVVGEVPKFGDVEREVRRRLRGYI
jgi:predicted nucleotidyltransferase component of viral defense system